MKLSIANRLEVHQALACGFRVRTASGSDRIRRIAFDWTEESLLEVHCMIRSLPLAVLTRDSNLNGEL